MRSSVLTVEQRLKNLMIMRLFAHSAAKKLQKESFASNADISFKANALNAGQKYRTVQNSVCSVERNFHKQIFVKVKQVGQYTF